MSDYPPDQVSADELRALESLQRLKQDAERCGHQFAGRMTSPSGTRYLVATDEPDNLAAWIFEQDDRATSSEPTAPAHRSRRNRLVRTLLRIRQSLSDIRKPVNIKQLD